MRYDESVLDCIFNLHSELLKIYVLCMMLQTHAVLISADMVTTIHLKYKLDLNHSSFLYQSYILIQFILDFCTVGE